MMSGHGTIETAVESTRLGAAAFLEKPLTMAKLLKAVKQALPDNRASTVRTFAGLSATALRLRKTSPEFGQIKHAAIHLWRGRNRQSEFCQIYTLSRETGKSRYHDIGATLHAFRYPFRRA